MISSRECGRQPATLAVVIAEMVLLTVVAIGPVQQTRAEEEVIVESVRRGALSYRVYCQTCHGATGRGDGPLASDLKHPPPDLSLLASRAGGRFPSLAVRRKIDGRDPVPSHGPSEMPVWGLTFALRGDADPDQVEQRIDDLVALLRSLQRLQGTRQ